MIQNRLNVSFVISAYTERGMPQKAIASLCGCSQQTIGRLLKRKGIRATTRKERPNQKSCPKMFSPEQEAEMIRAYTKEKLSQSEIANLFGCSQTGVGFILRRNGVEITDKRSPLPFDSRVFDQLNDESAYWLGMLATDGCVNSQNAISIVLQQHDAPHLEEFRKFLKAEHRVRFYDRPSGISSYAVMKIVSRSMAEKLKGYGITQRKTHTLQVSEELANNLHFWRGAIDGDGSLGMMGKNQPTIRLVSASLLFIQQYKTFIERFTDAKPILRKSITKYGNDFYSVNVHSKYAIELAKLLYPDGFPALSRKKERADKFKTMVLRLRRIIPFQMAA
jgi:hypothetical protein